MTDYVVYEASVPCGRRRWKRARWRTVYVGITNNLDRRIGQHQRERTGPHKLHPVGVVKWTVLAYDLTEQQALDLETDLRHKAAPECNGRVEPMTTWRRLTGLCVSWLRRSVRMARRGLELIGGAVVVTGVMWWWLG